MSKQSYVDGFCKAAAAQGVDPYALARIFAPMRKQAQAGGIWEGVKNVIDQVKQKWDEVDPSYKPLVGSLVGGGVGAGTGALAGKLFGFGAGRGALAGLGIGGLGGALYGSSAGNRQIAKALKADKAKALEEAGAKSRSEMESATAKHRQEMDAATAKYKQEIGGRDKQIADLAAGKKSDAEAAAKARAELIKKYKELLSGKDAEKAKALEELASRHDAQMAATNKAHEGMVGGLNKKIDALTAGHKSDADSIKRLESSLANARNETELARMIRDGKIDIKNMDQNQLRGVDEEVQKQMVYLNRLSTAIRNRGLTDAIAQTFGRNGNPSGAPIMTREQQISEFNRQILKKQEELRRLSEQIQKLQK